MENIMNSGGNKTKNFGKNSPKSKNWSEIPFSSKIRYALHDLMNSSKVQSSNRQVRQVAEIDASRKTKEKV